MADSSKSWALQAANELHRPVRLNFPRRKIIVTSLDQEWSSDLLDMSSFSKKNDGFKWVCLIIDVFSRFLWLRPMKNKKQKSVIEAFKQVFKESGVQPKRYLWTDMGGEYTGNEMKSFLKNHNIKLIHCFGTHKAAMSERYVLFCKNNLYRKMTEFNTENWVKFLPDIAQKHNTTRHRLLKLTPENARLPINNYWVMKRNLERKEPRLTAKKRKKNKKIKFKINDLVRISKSRNVFSKSYTTNWSLEQFRIRKIIHSLPPTFLLKDAKDQNIIGAFYSQEIQKSTQEIFYHHTLKTRKNKKTGKKEHLISWQGFPASYNSWTEASKLKNLAPAIDAAPPVKTEKRKRKIPKKIQSQPTRQSLARKVKKIKK